MKLTVFGANGKVGSLVVAEALKRGHEVVAFVHRSSPFAVHKNLKIVQGDINDAETVVHAITGSQAVISALGSWGTPTKDILATGMRNIIPAMQANNIKQVISITGAGASTAEDKPTTIDKIMHGLMDSVAHKVLYDGEEHIRLLQKSQLAWTVIRSPIMTELGQPKNYKLTMQRPSSLATINRHCVVQAMVDLAEANTYIKQAPFITR